MTCSTPPVLPTLLLATALAQATAQAPVAAGDPLLEEAALGARVEQLDATMQALVQRVDDSGDNDRDLREGCWQMLAFSAYGTTLRKGWHRDQLKTLARWLNNALRLPELEFAIGLDTPRDAHLLAAFALTRTCIEADYKLLFKSVQNACEGAFRKFTADDAAPATATECALLAMLAQSLSASKWQAESRTALRLAQDGVASIPMGRDRLADGVRHQLARLTGEQAPPELTLALCWPGDCAAAPEHAFFAAFVTRSLPAAARDAQRKVVARLLDRRADDDLWPAALPLDRERTTWILAGVVGVSCGDGGPAPRVAPAQRPEGDPRDGPIK